MTLELLELELLELELLELLELELLDPPGEPQGSTATVCVNVLLGMTSRLEPGGMLLLPDCGTTAASEHDVTAIVKGLCCLGITIVLTPGLISAAVTGSWLELEDPPPPLLPHAARPSADAAQTIRVATRGVTVVGLLIFSSAGR